MDAPNSIQIEFTEGCSMFCDFCGLHGIREGKGDYKFMTEEVARAVAHSIRVAGWTSRIEFAMHGEPSMNPGFVELVRIFRQELPKNQLMMTSNGSGFIKEGRVEQVFAAGLDILALDDYADGFVARVTLPANVPVRRYPEEDEGNPHRRYPKKVLPFVTVIADIASTSTGTHGNFTNHCGSAFPYEAVQRRCAKPFRELSVRWDGNVAICCEDWRGEFAVGNAAQLGVLAVWHHPRLQAARRFLINGDRSKVTPCNKCNHKSYRVGLLPDKLGKETLPEPTDQDLLLVREASEHRLVQTIVLRPWEK